MFWSFLPFCHKCPASNCSSLKPSSLPRWPCCTPHLPHSRLLPASLCRTAPFLLPAKLAPGGLPAFSIHGVSSISISCLCASLPFILWSPCSSEHLSQFVMLITYFFFIPLSHWSKPCEDRSATCLTCHVFWVPGTSWMFSTYLTREWVKEWNVLWLRLRLFLCTLKLHIYSCVTSSGTKRTLYCSLRP